MKEETKDATTLENINELLQESIKTLKSNKTKLNGYAFQFSPNIVKEIARVINENKQLQAENTKLKQEKKELVEWLNKEYKERDNSQYMTPLNCVRQSPSFECERKVLLAVLEKLGE